MKTILFALLVGISLFSAFGCSSETAQASAQEAKDFKGGPPPADLQERIAAAQAAGRNGGEAARQKALNGGK